MLFINKSNRGSAGRSTGLSGCSKTVACVQSQTPVRKASDKVLWFFFLLQGHYPFLFPFRQWAAKWGVQQPRLHFHPGRASTVNRGPADTGKTFDLIQWCAGHRQVQVRGIHTHSFSQYVLLKLGSELFVEQASKQLFFTNVDLKCGISPFHLQKFFLVLMFHSIFLKEKVV